MNTASGSRVISLMPSSDFLYFSIERLTPESSFFESSATFSASATSSSSSLKSSIDFRTVLKLVSMPPSQRRLT